MLSAAVGAQKPLTLQFFDQERPLSVATNACNATVCTAILAADAALRKEIAGGSSTNISYTIGTQKSLQLTAPLRGLSSALAVIN